MERFAIKIDRKLKANLYKICRLCGMDYPDMIPILPEDGAEPPQVDQAVDVESEPEMSQKINVLIGLLITKDDRMPQTMCSLCVDKINDFYEFREMCYATNAQTRKLLGLKTIVKKPVIEPKPKIEVKEEAPIVPPSMPNKLLNRKRKAEMVVEPPPAILPKKETAPPVVSNKKLRLAALPLAKDVPTKKTKFKAKEVAKETKEEENEVAVKEECREVLTRKLRILKEREKEAKIVVVKDEAKETALKDENKETVSKKEGKDKLKRESKELAALKKDIKDIVDLPPRKEAKDLMLKKDGKEVVPKKDAKELTSKKDGKDFASKKDGKDLSSKKDGKTEFPSKKDGKDVSSKDEGKRVTFKDDIKKISSKKDNKEILAKKGKHKNKEDANEAPAVKDEIKEEIKEESITAGPSVVNPAATAGSIVLKLKHGCTICTERFGSKGKLEAHVRLHHIPKVERYVCSACNETISKSFDIKNHQLWHKLSKTPYVCGLCGESIVSTYAYARHLQSHSFETPPALMVLDRECPQCHIQYETNFLYNTHPCAVKTRRCAGCNRLQRSETEYVKHSAICAKVYLNYSKHVAPGVEAQEDAVRIKNENEVEAAAEEMARLTGLPLDMSPVVHLTRLSSPIIMAANQCVSIPGLDDSPTTSGKRSGKKGVSKKELKRVDELLKSTLDALVSIKHEPEVHVEPETQPAEGEASDNETSDAERNMDHSFQEDYHHNEDSEQDDEAEVNKKVTNDKQHECVKIKQEADDNMDTSEIYEPANKTSGFGLKLKIRKEHGQLNSSIIEQQTVEKKAEKRKKKKKHKDKEKDKLSKSHKEHQEEHNSRDSFNTLQNEDIAPAAHSAAGIAAAVDSDKTDATVQIKTEPVENMDTDETLANSAQTRPQPEATIMTSIPMMQLQISCISEGVEFNGANTSTEAAVDEQANCVTNNHSISDDHEEDVKPNREELDRMLNISHVSSGVEMDATLKISNISSGIEMETDPNEAETPMDYNEEEEQDNQTQPQSPNENQSEQRPSMKNKQKTTKTKPIQKVTLKTPAVKSRNKACKSTAKPSAVPPSTSTTPTPIPTPTSLPVLQISAVQSGVTLPPTAEPDQSDFIPMFIKPEPQNRGYSDETTSTQPHASPRTAASSTPSPSHSRSPSPSHSHSRSPYPSPSPSPTPTEPEETTASQQFTAEEQAYISTIDFNNITIKQEKDLEINDIQVPAKKPRSRNYSVNGIKKRKIHHDHSKDDDAKKAAAAVATENDKDMVAAAPDENDEEPDEEEEEEEEKEAAASADEEEASAQEEDEPEEASEEEEEEEEEEDGEEDELEGAEEEEEEREYRELEYPPELGETPEEPMEADAEEDDTEASEMETNDEAEEADDNNLQETEETKSPNTPEDPNSSDTNKTTCDNEEVALHRNNETKTDDESGQVSTTLPAFVIASVSSNVSECTPTQESKPLQDDTSVDSKETMREQVLAFNTSVDSIAPILPGVEVDSKETVRKQVLAFNTSVDSIAPKLPGVEGEETLASRIKEECDDVSNTSLTATTVYHQLPEETAQISSLTEPLSSSSVTEQESLQNIASVSQIPVLKITSITSALQDLDKTTESLHADAESNITRGPEKKGVAATVEESDSTLKPIESEMQTSGGSASPSALVLPSMEITPLDRGVITHETNALDPSSVPGCLDAVTNEIPTHDEPALMPQSDVIAMETANTSETLNLAADDSNKQILESNSTQSVEANPSETALTNQLSEICTDHPMTNQLNAIETMQSQKTISHEEHSTQQQSQSTVDKEINSETQIPINTLDQSMREVEQHQPVSADGTPPNEMICNLAPSENAIDETEIFGTITGVVKQASEIDSQAQPIFESLQDNSTTEQPMTSSMADNDNNEEYDENGEENEDEDDNDEVDMNAEHDGADEDAEEEDEDYAESEDNTNPNIEELQNKQNLEQQLSTQVTTVRPAALALHPYLEDISSSSNSFLSNTLSQTPPPPLGNSNCPNSQQQLSHRTQQNEETENILNESNDMLGATLRAGGGPSSSSSSSHLVTTTPTSTSTTHSLPFNFDNINEIAENNNNANIEREQLQDDQHYHHHQQQQQQQQQHLLRQHQEMSPDDVT